MAGHPHIDPDDVHDVLSGFEDLLAVAAARRTDDVPVEEASAHVAEARVSFPYAQFVNREIDSAEYARRLREAVEHHGAVGASTRSGRASERVRQLELQARKAVLFHEYVDAQRAAHEARLLKARALWRLAVEVLLLSLATAATLVLAVVLVGSSGALQAAGGLARDVTAVVPDGVSMAISALTAAALCAVVLIPRMRRSLAGSPR
jgi:hypothetical protein